MNLALGDLQLSPVTGKPVAGEAVPKPVQAVAKAEEVVKTKPQEPAPQNSKKLTSDSTDMSYSVDSTASAFTIKITNKSFLSFNWLKIFGRNFKCHFENLVLFTLKKAPD